MNRVFWAYSGETHGKKNNGIYERLSQAQWKTLQLESIHKVLMESCKQLTNVSEDPANNQPNGIDVAMENVRILGKGLVSILCVYAI